MDQAESPELATALDYADALSAARSIRRWLGALLVLVVLYEVALFLAVHYRTTPLLTPATQPSDDIRTQSLHLGMVLARVLGFIVPLLLEADLLVILNIMLIGRLIGAASVLRACVWGVLLQLMLFPWETFLSHQGISADAFEFHGAIYGWSELVANGRWDAALSPTETALRWWRFAAYPVLAVVLLLWVQYKSGRGLRLAQGETTPALS